ncbi:hypothetical protein Hypma_010861 [Hypsizygus marmoreus]|uniref:Cargo-transport protein ypp1 n=1 Tax=Hypsizygus marmoreus TaxID=39966 RepID=A0A369JSY3_HYPMA|nr:hypothetical protein Hypma_010861 [Hypsizygus marmoreus]
MLESQKERYYWTQLRRTLAEGQWSAQYPAKTPNGIALSWSELFRKFNKHCKGFQDVTQVASQTQAIARLLAANHKDEDEDDTPQGVVYPLDLGKECTLPLEQIEEAKGGYEVLKNLKTSNFDTLNFALAYYAYALGNTAECLAHLNNVPDMLQFQDHIPVVGQEPSTWSIAGSFVSLVDSSAPEIKDGRVWAMTETLRSICLQGMSHEKLSPTSPESALSAYRAALPLLTTITATLISTSSPYLSTQPLALASFTPYRELWRWVERLLWRAICVSARAGDINDEASELWTWFRQYSACAVYWPANFRTAHRSTVFVLYLRALILSHSPTSSKEKERDWNWDEEKPPPWLGLARGVVNDYRAVLSASTQFPRAGERNVKVEDFADLCVGVWEASGAVGDWAGWVLDVLWWATRLTFNSHRILRHMTHLLHASGDTSLARRTLLLYAQVVSKAYQTNGDTLGDDTDSHIHWVETLIAGARMLCRFAMEGDDLEEAREAGTCIEKAKERLVGAESELDRDGKRAQERLRASVDLAEGVWECVMASKEQDPYTRPTRLAHAHDLFTRSITLHPTPGAYFHLALSYARPGIAWQDLDQAAECAGQAVEGDPQEVRYWHLLGLILAMRERWRDAGEILGRGAEIGEGAMEGENGQGNGVDVGDVPQRGEINGNGSGEVHTKDFGTAPPTVTTTTVLPNVNGNGLTDGSGSIKTASSGSISSRSKSKKPPSKSIIPLSLLPPDAMQIPAPESLLQPVPDHLPPSKRDRFEHSLQLRMTQGTLAEVVEGPEGAELKWLEVFEWIAERRSGAGAGGAGEGEVTPRASADGGVRPSEKGNTSLPVTTSPEIRIQAPSASADQLVGAMNTDEKAVEEALQAIAIPITVSPATPEGEGAPVSAPAERTSHEKKRQNGKRSSSLERDSKSIDRDRDRDRDTSKSKKVQQMLKRRVHKGQVRISSLSRRIGSGVVRNGSLNLKRAISTPDFHAILLQTSYQASSIHSRRRISSIIHHPSDHDRTPTSSPPPPPPSPVPPVPPSPQEMMKRNSNRRANRLVADLWLMSAATFRRLGKIDQARGAIQEAEVRDEGNPSVWVQLGLYYVALGQRQNARDAFQKALFINSYDVSASVHLARLYLSFAEDNKPSTPLPPLSSSEPDSVNVDLAAGILSHLTRGVAWDVPEAWYFLAKAYGMQGRKEKERGCLKFALELSGSRGIRELGAAVGWCI